MRHPSAHEHVPPEAATHVSAEGNIGGPVSERTVCLTGKLTATRQFYAAPGATQVSARYRFQTTELTFGWRYNDWYRVVIRNLRTGEQRTDYQTVGSLLAYFDANQATPWFTLTMPVAQPGDRLEVSVTVANVIDNAFPSAMYLDFVQERTHEISNVRFRDLITPNDTYAAHREDKPLTRLSASGMAAGLVSYDGFVPCMGRSP